MEADVAEFVIYCLQRVDSHSYNMEPRPLDEVVHSVKVDEVLHFDYLSLRVSDKIEMGCLVNSGYDHLLGLGDDLSHHLCLKPTEASSSKIEARVVRNGADCLVFPECLWVMTRYRNNFCGLWWGD